MQVEGLVIAAERTCRALKGRLSKEQIMQIYEAAYHSLKMLGEPSHLRVIYGHIINERTFEFGAADPIRVLGVQIDRHAQGVLISKPATPTLFYRDRPATYGLLEWLDRERADDLVLDEEIKRSAEIENLDSALFLEQELQRWLFKNWEKNGLTSLEFGALELIDPEQQHRKQGKFNTGVVGEMDMFFRARNGDLVICELKRQSDDQTIGQLCRYWGWAKEHMAGGNKVHGLVLAQEVGDTLRYAIKATNDCIQFRQLTLDVSLGPAHR